ncbi:hypothetical protein [Paenibacillus hexagrammi]|uniref:Uncharacterized protein n=1 Tax=Paenibacillus hexagrammi TaxID=2908839 RepID=A0ABY3SKQ2_9BACL|nr:hypothetical protein [Paenibacillus sp. YPD9-1]UJF33804.1 hypothetical protein L0M14_00600 [Paenibacillus sp. YPD9-1]
MLEMLIVVLISAGVEVSSVGGVAAVAMAAGTELNINAVTSTALNCLLKFENIPHTFPFMMNCSVCCRAF